MDNFTGGKHLFYTVITGDYDSLQRPVWNPPNVDYLAILDSAYTRKIAKPWKLKFVEAGGDPKIANRALKMDLFPEPHGYASITYLDGNVRVVRSMAKYISEFLSSGKAVSVFEHFDRATPFQEVRECVKEQKLTKFQADFELNRISDLVSDPGSLRLFDGGVLMVNPTSDFGDRIFSRWKYLFDENPVRDQIPLSIVQNELKEQILVFPNWRRSLRPELLRVPHNNESSFFVVMLFSLSSCFPQALSAVQQLFLRFRRWHSATNIRSKHNPK